MKKSLIALILSASFLVSGNCYANLLNTSYGDYDSKIPLDPTTGGQCAHFAEEMFYEFNGISLNIEHNSINTWKSFENKEFMSINGYKYKIEMRKTPTAGSICFIDNVTHLMYVKSVDKENKRINVYESSTTFSPDWGLEKIQYKDTWYLENTYSFRACTNGKAVFMTAVFVDNQKGE